MKLNVKMYFRKCTTLQWQQDMGGPVMVVAWGGLVSCRGCGGKQEHHQILHL